MLFAPTKGKDCFILQVPGHGVMASASRDVSPVGAGLPNARHSSQLQLFFSGLLSLQDNASAHDKTFCSASSQGAINLLGSCFHSWEERKGEALGLKPCWDSTV